MKTRTISFSIRGFDQPVDDVAKIIGRRPTSSGAAGQPVNSHSTQTLKRNYVSYEKFFGNDDLWDDAILGLIEHLGGVSLLSTAIDKIKPEFVQIDITSPVRSSDEQEDRYISFDVLRVVADLKIDLAFGFI